MKKIAILAVLTLAVACGLTACKKADEKSSSASTSSSPASQPDHIQIVADDSDVEMPTQPICGGWTDSEDGVITEAAQKAFDKAMETFEDDGMVYTPVSLLSTQVVSGMNYAFLCTGHPADAESTDDDTTYKVIVYADLDGNATVTSVEESTP